MNTREKEIEEFIRTIGFLTGALGNKGTLQVLVDEIGVPIEKVAAAQRALFELIESFHDALGEDGAPKLRDRVHPDSIPQ